ncbi:MAG: hypothetical protein OHK0054_06350 [Sideroxydans sp.]
MKSMRLYVVGLLLTCALPSHAVQTGQDCEARAKGIAIEKRNDFLQHCLKQARAADNVRVIAEQDKRRTCEQNARNLRLNPGQKPGYIEECMRRNEAAAAARKYQASPRPKLATPKPPTSAPGHDAAPSRAGAPSPRQKCAQQARARGLKGTARKTFLQECRAARP